jgi:hypothetical protein
MKLDASTLQAFRKLQSLMKREARERKEKARLIRYEKNARAIDPLAIVPTTVEPRPNRVLVLDIETSGKLEERPHPNRIVLVGVKEFNRVVEGYRPLPYEHYEPETGWKRLRSRLEQPFDVVLGHNLFNFDYYFLEKIISIKPLIPRTVDTLLWLCTCIGHFRRLGLANLGCMNLNAEKLRSGKPFKQLLTQPDKTPLFRYNERDLDLTFRFWIHALELKVTNFGIGPWKPSVADLSHLRGQQPLLDFKTWSTKRRNWGSDNPSPLHRAAIISRLGQHDTKRVTWPSYTVIVCNKCQTITTFLVKAPFRRVLEEGEDSASYSCNKRKLRTFRLRCNDCGDWISGKSSCRPVLLGSARAVPPRTRLKAGRSKFDWLPSSTLECPHLLAPFGASREKLFTKFKLGRASGSGCSLLRNPTSEEEILLTNAASESYKARLRFNTKRTIYALFESGNSASYFDWKCLHQGLDGVLERYWRKRTTWVAGSGFSSDFCCQVCGAKMTIHDIPVVHPIFGTPICQSCARLVLLC